VLVRTFGPRPAELEGEAKTHDRARSQVRRFVALAVIVWQINGAALVRHDGLWRVGAEIAS